MSVALLATKIYVPHARPNAVSRPRLTVALNEGLSAGRKLTLISAPAGFGKTTLVTEWIASCGQPVAWLSLDEADNEPTRFLAYLVAALQTIMPHVGEKLVVALQSPQPPSGESILTSLLNEITALPERFIIVLDDYHVVEARSVEQALTFLLEHLPPQMHLVMATREDPHLPLARLRAGGQLTELRAADLRFRASEAAEFLNRVMGLSLSAEDIAALEARTEGWIAGLQLAAISMQGHKDSASFVRSFTGSHHFVMDYLVEEVLQQQSESIQAFLLRTSILNRMCGSLCDAVLADPAVSGQEILEHLEHANLFVVPLDNELRWYRYHHLFAELLRQRLQQSGVDEVQLHQRASTWYEGNGLDIEAFQHAAAANDVERAERLIAAAGMPVYSLATATTILDWLNSLPRTVLDAGPSLWVRSATLSLMAGRTTGVEEKLQAAETAMQRSNLGDTSRDLMGQIAAVRATLAVVGYRPEAALIQSRRALECLHADNVPFRSRALWALGFAHQLQGDRAAARQAYVEAIRQASGNTYYTILTTTSLGQIQESENELHQAAETYRHSLLLFGDQGPPSASEEYIGLARIFYEWNEMDAAERHAELSLQLARQYDRAIDRYITVELLLARIRLARGDATGAAAMLVATEQSVRQNNYVQRWPEVAAARVLTLLHQGSIAEAAALAQAHDIPLSRARVHLAQGEPAEALAVLGPYRQQVEARNWQDERLRTMIVQAVAFRATGERDKAAQMLHEALALAEPGGFIRSFVDEGAPMAELLTEAAAQRVMPDYTRKLLAAFEAGKQTVEDASSPPTSQPLIEPLSERELEVLRLIAQGLSNQQISQRLFLALSTVKGHNRLIFNKLQVQRRTEAVRRARELDLL